MKNKFGATFKVLSATRRSAKLLQELVKISNGVKQTSRQNSDSNEYKH
ncbi:MAG: hypothetical protein H0X72_18380 [Acidobacteria bacterium]|nr:hypothetical protein [Acidobacteriota bacterium]